MAFEIVTDIETMKALNDQPEAPLNFLKLTHKWHRWSSWHPRAVVRKLNRDWWVAIIPLQANWGIVVGHLTEPGAFRNQWGYYYYSDALMAASNWDGTFEPEGWTSHPSTGRRRG